jgi:hypothetical protein
MEFQGWQGGTFVYTHDQDTMDWEAHLPLGAQIPMEFASSDLATHRYEWQPAAEKHHYSWSNLRLDIVTLEDAMDCFARTSPWHGTPYQTAQRIRKLQEKIAVAKDAVTAGEVEYKGDPDGPRKWLDRMLYRTLPKALFANLLTEKKGTTEAAQKIADECHEKVMTARQTLVNHQTFAS